MPDKSWYETVDGASLLQGDILVGCPVTIITGPWNCPFNFQETAFETLEATVIVLTQSCDLENDKVEFVLLAPVTEWASMVRQEIQAGNSAVKSRDFRRKLVDGAIPGLSLPHKHDALPKLEWSVVNFRRLYTLPKSFLQQYAQSQGLRLRLRSPYREHLAQAFARYFMRVGLPYDAKAFEKEGEVIP
ncbi:MAG: hypothetical protein FJ303_05045 [Planctomycetes bacterium]|nr:hypothetical protein [Planctomycetota bacterium]